MGMFSAASYTSQEFKKVSLKNEEVSRVEFEDCKFTRCNFQEVSFLNCKFTDCAFVECDWRMVNLKGSTFADTRFDHSELIGLDWTATTWRSNKVFLGKPVDFLSCVINYNVFIGLNLTGIKITRCTAQNVAFDEANLTKTDCSHTDFTDSRFASTNLTEADFTGAKHYTIDVQQNTVKKTKFSLPEAISLLNSFDIVLTEPRS